MKTLLMIVVTNPRRNFYWAKPLLLFFIFIVSFSLTHGQDIIFKIDGTEIQCKVVDIDLPIIKYNLSTQPSGPIRQINSDEVFMILYKDGTTEKFVKTAPVQQNVPPPITPGTSVQNAANQNQATSTSSPDISENKAKSNSSFFKNRNKNYFAVSIGNGVSYGGYGIRLQGRIGKTLGAGIHIGAGYFPDNGGNALASVGLKFFYYKYLYINLQYGTFGIRNYYDDKNLVKANIWGPSFLAGVDWIGERFGANAAVGVSKGNGHDNTKFKMALDFGFIIKLTTSKFK